MPPGVDLLETEEGVPILETGLIARELRPVLLSHEGHPISAEQGIHEAGLLHPPALVFFLRDRVEVLLESAPFNACDDVGGFDHHGFLLCTAFCLEHIIRDGGNVLSGESQHLRRGKTCKGRWNRPQRSLRYAGMFNTIRAADLKRVGRSTPPRDSGVVQNNCA
jgi:hypothetical protein